MAAAISLYEWRLQQAMFREVIGIEMLAALVTASVAVLACGVIWAVPGLSWLLVVVAAAGLRLLPGLRLAAAALRQPRAAVQLHPFGRHLRSTPARPWRLLLTKAADLLRAEVSEITLFDASRRSRGLRKLGRSTAGFDTAAVTPRPRHQPGAAGRGVGDRRCWPPG